MADEEAAKRAWDVEQANVQAKVVQSDGVRWVGLSTLEDAGALEEKECEGLAKPLRLVGGVDISFVKDSDAQAVAALVVLSYPTCEVLWEALERVTLSAPYISGYLAFREVEHLLQLVDRLKAERPDLLPDIVLVDGNGVLHPRGAGLASHFGVACGLKTIGIGKTFLHVDGLTKDGVRDSMASALSGKKEACIELRGESGVVHGMAMCSQGSSNPIFISVGHGLSLDTCMRVVKGLCKYRIPEPVRQADIRSREAVRVWVSEAEVVAGAEAATAS